LKLPRFYCNPITTGKNKLCAEESHHLIHVSRLNVSDEIELFDGNGVCANAKVTTVKRSEVVVDVTNLNTLTSPNSKRITIAASIPKGKRFDWMIAKCTELGVDQIVPIIFDRTVKQPAQTKDRCTKIAIAAAKQSGISFLPAICEPKKITLFLENLTTDNANISIFFGHLSQDAQPVQTITEARGDVVAVVGPEGGLSATEIQLLRDYRAQAIRLTNTTLRVETAAICFASIFCAFRDSKTREHSDKFAT
jgi:16S rRNA (uracil1498-N3)-methyltransferase